MRGNIRASDVAKDRELLNRLGYGVLDVQTESGDVGFEDVRRYSYLVAPELSPRATARRLRDILGRPFSEEEARAAWDEILRYKLKRLRETGENVPIEQAAREWDQKYGFGFRRRWYLTRPEPGEKRYVPGAHERSPGAVARIAGRILPELKPLLEAGFSVSDILTIAARNPLQSARLVLRKVPRRERDRHYVQLVADITGWTLPPEQAEKVWEEALRHKLYVKEHLGQDISMERAVVDYVKRLRLSGLDRAALWETGRLFPTREESPEEEEASTPG